MSNERKGTELAVLSQELKVQSFRQAYDATLPSTLRRLMPLDRAVNILVRSLQKNPKLAASDPRTLKQCLLDSAALGLELNGPLHHAYAVPYYNGRKQVTEAQLQIGYQGLLELARRTGEIDGAPIVQWVYEKDDFEINFASHQTPIRHKPYLDGPRGDPKLVYCLAWFKSGGYHFDFMSYSDVLEHRDKFAKKDKDGRFSDAWEDNELEMGRKTIIRRAAKHWPLSSEFADALEHEEQREMGNKSTIIEVLPNEEPEPVPASRTEKLAERLAPEPAKRGAKKERRSGPMIHTTDASGTPGIILKEVSRAKRAETPDIEYATQQQLDEVVKLVEANGIPSEADLLLWIKQVYNQVLLAGNLMDVGLAGQIITDLSSTAGT